MVQERCVVGRRLRRGGRRIGETRAPVSARPVRQRPRVHRLLQRNPDGLCQLHPHRALNTAWSSVGLMGLGSWIPGPEHN
eukprot:3703166-Rhodomonas_salina.5